MNLRWTERAEADFASQCDFIAKTDPHLAERLAIDVIERIGGLSETPFRGRSGRVVGTRELLLPGLPWVVVYEVQANTIFILRLLHGAQSWPT